MYAKLINGILIEAPQSISNNIEKMKEEGYKPVIFSRPNYDIYTQYCNLVGYEETAKYIRHIYDVVEIEPSEAEIKLNEATMAMTFLEINFDEQIQTLTDEEALQVKSLYKNWEVGVSYDVNYKVMFNDVLYKVLQAHTSQADWSPKNAVSLYAPVLVGEADEVLEWIQPDSTNPYMTGDKVIHNGVIYISTVDNNVWEPGVYGWDIVDES